MGIVKRFSTLLKADIHGVLDVMEDPRDVCKQAIREMEEELEALRCEQRSRASRAGTRETRQDT